MVLCVDEKTQIQALHRSQPLLAMGLGYVAGVTHDTIRHGATTLFAALDVATGEGITQCRPCHRHQEFLGLLRQIETSVPEDLDVHLVVDNDCTRKHPLDRRSSARRQVRSWWAQRPRVHGHDTPTDACWLNQVERWLGILTQRAIRNGTRQAHGPRDPCVGFVGAAGQHDLGALDDRMR